MIAKYLFGFLFVVAGISHFRFTSLYVRIVPPFLPLPKLLVQVSGVCEFLLGILLLLPNTQKLAAWGLIALLIAVFPANIYMTIHPELFPRIPVWSLWIRLPLQAMLIAWAYLYTKG